jgi:hypothetical protein
MLNNIDDHLVVTCLGDVDNDGADEIGIGAPNASKFYLVFGHK